MPHVGLLSLPRYFNYGSQLQLFALQSAIERVGNECAVIDYEPPMPPPMPTMERIQRIIGDPMALVHGMRERRVARRELTLTRERGRLFQEFSKKYIHIQGKSYRSYEALRADPPRADTFVVGSDQVWNPIGHFGDDSYYLRFAPEGHRIAYAPSIGLSVVPDTAKAWMRECLHAITHLSVRESKGAELIRELTGREAKVVVDPTLLLDAQDWGRIATTAKRAKGYVLCYALQSDRYAREHALRIANAHGLDLVVLPFHHADIHGTNADIIREFDVGPSEFVGLIRGASFVCTDSFHGTVFSVIFRKPFHSYRRYEADAATFSRMADLLARLKLSDRAVGIDSDLSVPPLALDYSDAAPALDAWRAESWSYLETAIRDSSAGMAHRA